MHIRTCRRKPTLKAHARRHRRICHRSRLWVQGIALSPEALFFQNHEEPLFYFFGISPPYRFRTIQIRFSLDHWVRYIFTRPRRGCNPNEFQPKSCKCKDSKNSA